MSARRVRVSAAVAGLALLCSVLVWSAAPLQAAPAGNGRIAYVTRDNTSIRIVDPDGSDDAEFVAGSGYVGLLSWSPDGSTLAWVRADGVDGVLELADADGSDVRTIATVDNDIATGQLFGVQEVVWSPDGTRLLFGGPEVFAHDTSMYFVVNADGSGSSMLPAPPPGSRDYFHVWSPDSTRLAFSRGTYDPATRQERADLAVVDADGSDAGVIASLGGLTWIDAGAWTADDRIVAGVRGEASGTSTVWTIRPDGTGAIQVAALPAWAFSPPVLSPDESTVLILDSLGLRRFPLAGGPITTIDLSALGQTYLSNPLWSPDGTSVMIVSDYPPLQGVVTMRPDGTDAAVVADTYLPPAWQPVPVQADRWRVNVTGGITYSADAPVSGNLAVAKDSSGVRQVSGSGTYQGVGGSTATVSVAVNRFWILPIHVGTVRVDDPGASLSLEHVVFFSRVDATATGSTSSQSWFDLSRWPWRSYSMTWQIDDTT